MSACLNMLAVSVAYKCCDHRGVSSKDIPNYWQDHLITVHPIIAPSPVLAPLNFNLLISLAWGD